MAIANFGGSLILFGVADDGADAGVSVDNVAGLDLADVANRVGRPGQA